MSKKIAALIIAFVLAVCLVAPVIALNVVTPLMSREYWFNKAESSGYFTNVKEYVEKDILQYSIPSGFPKEVFQDSLSISSVVTYYSNQLEAAMNSRSYTATKDDYGEFKQTLLDRFREYADSLSLDLTPEQLEQQQEALNYTANLCVNSFLECGRLQYFMLAERYVVSYRSALTTMSIVCLCLAAAALLTLVISLKKRALSYISYALGGAALLGFAPEIYLKAIGFYSKFGFDPPYLLDYFYALEGGVMNRIMLWSAVLAVLSVILIAADLFINKSKKTERN